MSDPSGLIAGLDDVHVSYDGTPALRGLELDLYRGAGISGLLGRNGAGKTTTIRTILGLVRPSGGSVQVFGEDPSVSFGVRRRMSVMLAEDGLLREMTVRENLVSWAGLFGVDRRRVDELLEGFELMEMRGRRVSDLSTGYRRVVALARAMIPEYELLILDEPTSSLDPARAIEVRRMILDLKLDRTILISTHNLAEAEELCDHISIIHEGRIAAAGSPESLAGEARGCLVRTASGGVLEIGGETLLPGPDDYVRVPLREGEQPSELLRRLVESGIAVAEFRPARKTLAEVFMEATDQEERS